jgi:arsenate reductase
MKPKVAFVCVHNSCRSQMAEALGKLFASDIFSSYSAGTVTKPQINQDAVDAIKELYGINMNETQYSKLLIDIPIPDIVIKMGCIGACPILPSRYEEDWGLDDPTDKDYNEFKNTALEIEKRIRDLADRIKNNEINLREDSI